jgi:chemotaxis protein methyltransferase CheR
VNHLSASSTAFAGATAAIRVPDRSLILLRNLVHAHTGMFYDEPRFVFLKDRLAVRALECGFDSLLDYYYLLKYDSGAADEWPHAIDALAVHETYFWREADQLQALTDGILPLIAARGPGPIRIWSLPCSTGEEPLSIAIALTEAGWFSRAVIHLHASDASEAALRRARAGRYSARSFRQLPDALRRRYFAPVDGSSDWTIAPEVHARVRTWTRVNAIRDDEIALHGGCDVIFCRNMFIYFDHPTVTRVVDAFANAMSSPGFLCVAAAESLIRLTTRFDLQEVAGAYVYVKP